MRHQGSGGVLLDTLHSPSGGEFFTALSGQKNRNEGPAVADMDPVTVPGTPNPGSGCCDWWSVPREAVSGHKAAGRYS